MRTFCTEGPVDPHRNYVVPRTDLLEIGLNKVEDWRYFTLFAPRQSGKSTYFQMLCAKIQMERQAWLPVWITFEHYHKPALAPFLSYFQKRVMQEANVTVPLSEDILELPEFFLRLSQATGKDIVLVIDEVEGLQNPEVLNIFLHAIRSLYHKREHYRLRSTILVGVSNITGILQDTASPFNIADQIDIPYFSFDETKDLLEQHTQETGQAFSPEVIQKIYDNTVGQPGLVNALARDLVEKRCAGMPEIGMASFYQTLDAFLRLYVDKNIANVVNKARQHPEIMKQILFDGPIEFTMDDPALSFLKVNGVIDEDAGISAIKVPLYKKRLYQAFKLLQNGNSEVRYFKDPFVDEAVFLDSDGYLDISRLIDNYAAYFSRRGNVILSGEKFREGLYHYNLDAFLASYAGVFGGSVYPEVPEGGGRVDLLVVQGRKRWIVEVKRFLNLRNFEQGKRQIAAYVKRSNLGAGYLVVFSDVHPQDSHGRETVDGQEVMWWILPVNREVPSQY